MQSRPARRNVYVRPQNELRARGKTWKMLRLPYGIVEAGRQWFCDIGEWMIKEYEMKRVFGVDQLFIRRVLNGSIGFLVAKLVDDFLLSGTESEITRFFDAIDKFFKLGVRYVGNKLQFIGCDMDVTTECDARVSMELTMDPYIKRVRTI